MKHKNLIVFLVVTFLGLTSAISAQELSAPKLVAKESAIPLAGVSEKEPLSDEPGCQGDGSDGEQSKSGEEKQDEEIKDKNIQDDEKKQDEKKQDEKKQDEKKQDEKEQDEKEQDEKAKEEKKSTRRRRRGQSIWSRNSQRVRSYSKQAKDFVAVFEPVVASSNGVAVQVMSGKKQVALGTVVSSDGLVLTKASELRGELFCTLNDGEVVKASLVGIHPISDLALLKIEAENLTAAQWSDDPAPSIGRWIASPKANKELPMIGVVSVNARKIPPSSPFMGISPLDVEDKDGVRINVVENESPADEAGLQINDLILKIDDVLVKDRSALFDILSKYNVGDRIKILIRRFKEEKIIKLTLGARDKISTANHRSNLQNDMGSRLSQRRKDFPLAFQHDSMLNSDTCGGPIVDLTGRVVGVNIARAGRVSSLALPVATVLPILAELKTGDWAPGIVNKEKIESINSELEEIEAMLGRLPDKKNVLDQKYRVEKARLEEIETSIKSIQESMKTAVTEFEKNIKILKDRKETVGKKSTVFESELKSVKKDIAFAKQLQKRLKRELDQLNSGNR